MPRPTYTAIADFYTGLIKVRYCIFYVLEIKALKFFLDIFKFFFPFREALDINFYVSLFFFSFLSKHKTPPHLDLHLNA